MKNRQIDKNFYKFIKIFFIIIKMRSIIELMNFYHENKEDIESFLKQQKKENYKSLRELYQNRRSVDGSVDRSADNGVMNRPTVVEIATSNEGIIFWIIDLIIIIFAIWLIIQNGKYMDNVSVAFAVMLLLLPLGPLFSIVIVFVTRSKNIED